MATEHRQSEPPVLPNAPLIKQCSLRDYQLDAIAKSRLYIAAFKKGKDKGAALVHMATGTGKTGIISCLARCIPEVGPVLVLAPRVALCDQLELDIRTRFFERLERRPPSLPKSIVRVEKLFNAGARPVLADKVIIGTFQMLESMSRATTKAGGRQARKRRLYEQLKRRAELIIVDEGHYEPALSWSRAIRDLDLPRVLFTATPYRNDLKRFHWEFHYTSHFTLSKATAQNVIRTIKVIPRTPTRDPRKFLQDILNFYDSHVKPFWSDARVIIRCDNRTSIDQMAQVLLDEKRSFLAIHDTFKDVGGEDWERRSVPRREGGDKWYGPNGPVFWVHQFKLLEGIDDDRFRLVAIFEPLQNDRQVVQQIGRVIRNPDCGAKSDAYVLDHARGHHQRAWEALFKFDDDLANTIAEYAKHPKGTSTLPGVNEPFINDVLKAHPPQAYVGGRARNRFSFEAFRPLEDLRLPLAANLLLKTHRFDLEKMARGCERRLQEADRIVKLYRVDSSTVVLMYVAVNNAPFLDSSYFLSGNPGIVVICELPHVIALYDSGGTSPLGLPGISRAVTPEYLRKLFSGRRGSKLIEVAAKNAHLGNRAIRSRSISASSLEETIPGLDDHVQVLTRVTGYSVEPPPIWDSDSDRELRRRYLGFHHGRVVESGERVSFDDYRAWLRELDSMVVGERQRLKTFSRYAADAKDVYDPTPRNVLLDLYEVLESYKTVGNEQEGIPRNRRLEIDDLCQDVAWKSEPGGKSRYVFWVTANGQGCEVEIEWDKARRRYRLFSRALDKIYRPDPERGSLISYLNREQSFRVLPSDKRVIYVDGDFYELMIPIGSRFDRQRYHVGKILRPLPALRSLWDEKGRRCLSSGADWDADSLFGFISRGIAETNEITGDLGNVDIAVCDDMGTEIADFILADKDRVIFIHAKGIGRSAERAAAYSAGKLSLICGQAIKNVQYLSMFNNLKPKNLKRWSEPWSSPDTTEGQVLRRIIRPLGRQNNEKIWQQLRDRIGNPRTTREVWLILGGILSKDRFERELSKGTAEAVQALTLLHGTLATIGSIDAKFKVLCHD